MRAQEVVMAEDEAVLKLDPVNRVDPVVKFRFALTMTTKGKPVDVLGWFTECSGLTVERESKSYEEGGVNAYVHQLPGRVKQSRITLKRGLADNALWDWFKAGLFDGKVERRNVSIVLYNSNLTMKKQWDLDSAFPVKWTGPDFQSDTNQVAIEAVELVHHGLSMKDWSNA
jgi:phage tail-like protein